MTENSTAVCIDRIEKSYRDGTSNEAITVLAGVTLKIHKPCVVSIVGPNGVGKTTFLRMLAGLVQPDRGTVLINGQPPIRSRLGYVPQGNPVFPWRRVVDDIALPLEILGLSRDERRSHVERLVNHFSFDLPLQRRAHGLSGGQRQLVNLCRALVGPEPPKVLLLDEPFSALDVISRYEFLGHLQRVVSEVNPTVFLTTHQLDMAILTADIVVPFRNRPVVRMDVPPIEVLFARPRTAELRTSAAFQDMLATVERFFDRASMIGGPR